MATTVSLRKILDRKQWEMCGSLSASALSSKSFVAQSTLFDQYQAWAVNGSSTVSLYDPREDAFSVLPAAPINAVSSSDIVYHSSGPTGTASAATSTSLSTTTNLPGSVAGYTVRITAGTGAGQERTVSSNTYGANAVLTVSSAWATVPDSTSQYLLLTGRFWLYNGNATPALRYYDLATNTWSGALSVTGITAASVGFSVAMAATPAYGNTIASGTATAGTTTTLTNSGKSWSTNQWTNFQVRLTAGTGAGQVRTVASNTATALTVTAAWTVAPDATSAYVIEPNDDYLYLTQQGAVALYRYSISGNAWTTLSPGVARSVAPGQGTTLNWIGIAAEPTWADETNIKNGRWLYSWDGSSAKSLSAYDIAANTWVAVTYGRNGGTDFSLSTGYNVIGGDREFLYILQTSSTTGLGATCWRYNCAAQTLDPWTMWPTVVSSSNQGRAGSVVTYNDGGTALRWVYWGPSGAAPSPLYRMLII